MNSKKNKICQAHFISFVMILQIWLAQYQFDEILITNLTTSKIQNEAQAKLITR